MRKVLIPARTIEIGRKAFYNCRFLRQIILPPSIKRIAKDVCSEMTQSEGVVFYAPSDKVNWLQEQLPYNKVKSLEMISDEDYL